MDFDKSKQLKAISLFSGMGGDTLGMTNAGVKVIAFSENVKYIRDTHLANFNDCEIIGEDVNSDITKIPDEEFRKYKHKVDIIFAGFPCQGFSNAGKKKINDPRNTLFREFVRATKLIQPKIIIGENVKGLLSRKTSNNEKYISLSSSHLSKTGYKLGKMFLFRDITDKIIADRELIKSKQISERAQVISKTGNWEDDHIDDILRWSKNCKNIFEDTVGLTTTTLGNTSYDRNYSA